MSRPDLPDNPDFTREDVINLILASIAMEELGLSHIINAEGEKLQYALGTGDGTVSLTEPATVKDLLDLNKSVRKTLGNATKFQMLLTNKMESAMGASVTQGPPGPTGPKGETGEQGPTGQQGSEGQRGPAGPQGIQGIAGTVGTIKGSYESEQGLRNAHPDGGKPGDFYYINPDLWVWDEDNNDWVNVGEIAGPQGLQGIQGERGDAGPAGPQGPKGDIGPEGPIGKTGVQGPKGDIGPKGDTGEQGPEASSFTIIPFASQRAPLTYAANGVPTRVSLIGFGYLDRGIGSDVSIPLASNASFNLSQNADRQLVFSVPFDMKITSIYATVGNFDVFPIGQLVGTVFPYIQLYSALPNSNTFNPIPGATAIPIQGLGPTPVPAATMLPASVTGLNVELTAGTRIAIGGLVKINNDTASRSYYLYFTGAIGMTRWFR